MRQVSHCGYKNAITLEHREFLQSGKVHLPQDHAFVGPSEKSHHEDASIEGTDSINIDQSIA
jgi:hypothetical protein